MAEKPAQPSAFPTPTPILNSAAQNLIENTQTYESDGFLYHFYKKYPPIEKPDRNYHPRTVTFYILDSNL